MTPNQITTLGSTKTQASQNIGSAKSAYICANAEITRGITSQPSSINECYERFPNIKKIGQSLGITYDAPFFPEPIATPTDSEKLLLDLYTGLTASESVKIKAKLGEDWLGCLWGSPEAPFSSGCPNVGEKYEAYLKHRLNVATFWDTPISTPAQRQEFLDSLKFGPKINMSIAGDASIRPGDIVTVRVDNISGYPYDQTQSILSNKFYVLSVKNTYTNSGVHDTLLSVTRLVTPINISGPITIATEDPTEDPSEEQQ
jgi:hypothetical protein